MEYAVIATPDDGLGLRLDWERFSYAGKFVMTNTGKAVVAEDGILDDPEWPPAPRAADTPGVIAAVSFNRDRLDPETAWLRYVTVRRDRRGRGIGPRLCAFTADWLKEAFDVRRVRIAVNNPYAFDALHKAGFAWTGEETGLRERVLERPAVSVDATVERRYVEGLRSYLETDGTDGTDAQRSFIEDRTRRGPPALVEVPKGEDYTAGARTNR